MLYPPLGLQGYGPQRTKFLTVSDPGGGAFIDRSHGAIANQSSHRVFGSPAYVSATSPASLPEANLNNATVTVLLGGTTFASGVSTSSFALVTNPAVSGLSVASVTGGASGSTSATLTLAITGDISAPTTLAVRVLAAAHAGDTALTTGQIDVLQGADTAPAFGAGSLSAQRFARGAAIARGTAIAPFQIPAATGGNGGPAYTASGLPYTDRRIATAPACAPHATDRLQSPHRPHHRGQETER